ncbi:hypothetical protein OSSY52_05640 [Tepiditoga spiralis]|uniref:Uncharacterized protein n=1 Tax=Tepiditoga spiralis TaxID=2108365 RepID=A0A7G1G6H1_9BACT|nr:hypothetical protein [Tepiditoga spiralis]BBE30423.1 hypothetical protein OSSY52_05640 [Tepiditoga spiralis]
MPFIEEIKKLKSLSVVGLQKNTGKTETLNYIIKRLKNENIGMTSIGIDGESTDQVTQTPKPEIKIYKNMIFATAEKFYKAKKFTSEILDVSAKTTSIGRVVIARALEEGKVLLAGPQDTVWIKQTIDKINGFGTTLTLVDGAISRLSPSSPAITEGMVLATGAALTINMKELVKKTKHTINLINIEEFGMTHLKSLKNGVYMINESKEIKKLSIKSILNFEKLEEDFFSYGNTIYTTGSITDKFLKYLSKQKNIKKITVVVKDFTKIFVTPEVLSIFKKRGGTLKVLKKTKLIAVTVNPTSPNGYTLNSLELKNNIQELTTVPVINVREETV